MSTATVAKVIVPKPQKFEVITTVPEERQPLQENPLLPVFVVALISFFISTVAIGSVVFWIFMRHSGMLPFDSIGR
ncbi:MAG: hypothetical protein DMG65_17940 [Candidatus Angelobacter sp. Gp1-AA117]|nr:MAG: hypothetical protein DMG65_17940 [Candidatus Angelobacter sp. Gp1-AA117]